jgi:hypothetical protein
LTTGKPESQAQFQRIADPQAAKKGAFMADKSSKDDTSKPSPGKGRDERLAEALRLNLKRRKEAQRRQDNPGIGTEDKTSSK